MVRVLATASLLRTFQPHPGDALCSDYSGLRPIYATQSHPKMLTLAHTQSLSGAKLRSGSESPNARSLYFLAACCSTKFFDEPYVLLYMLDGGESEVTGSAADLPRGAGRREAGDLV